MSLINANQLIEAAKNKGLKFEYFSLKFDRWDEEIGNQYFAETFVQVEIKPSVWFTWIDHGDFLHFKGRYNQVNGASQRTYRIENNAFYSIGLSDYKY